MSARPRLFFLWDSGKVGPFRRFDWSFLDRAYCISLRSRDDRADAAAAALHGVGLCRLAVFCRPLKHPVWPLAGIWEARRSVALSELDSGCRTVLILEDDVAFSRRLKPRTVQRIGHSLARLPADWMIFYLGHMPWRAYFVSRNVLRVSSTAAHAYVASPRLLEWLRDRPGIRRLSFAGMGIDAAYAKLTKAYAFFPWWPPSRRPRATIIAHAMVPSQFVMALLSPLFLVLHWLERALRRG